MSPQSSRRCLYGIYKPPRSARNHRIAGNIGGHKIWQICYKKHLAVSKFGRFRSPRPKMSQKGCWCSRRPRRRGLPSGFVGSDFTTTVVFSACCIAFNLCRLQPSRGCFKHCEVRSNSSGTIFSCVSPYLCSLFRRIARVRAASRTALHADFCLFTRREPASCACSGSLSPSLRERHTGAQVLLSVHTVLQQGHLVFDCNACA